MLSILSFCPHFTIQEEMKFVVPFKKGKQEGVSHILDRPKCFSPFLSSVTDIDSGREVRGSAQVFLVNYYDGELCPLGRIGTVGRTTWSHCSRLGRLFNRLLIRKKAC